MTLDEAIAHAKEAARTCDDSQCAADHIQIAEWLRTARGAEAAGRWYTAKLNEARLDMSKLMTENAKLREMVRDMRYCIKRNHRCDDCNFNVGTNCLLFVNINKRMRELGVEVD